MVRSDSSRAETVFPKKGPFPHDAVHYAVERHLGLRRGFWGLVAEGIHPEDIVEMAKAAGHASASRAQTPESSIVELLQAERIVECFEADLWGGAAEMETLLETISVACAFSHVPIPVIQAAEVEAIRGELAKLTAQWATGRIDFYWAD